LRNALEASLLCLSLLRHPLVVLAFGLLCIAALLQLCIFLGLAAFFDLLAENVAVTDLVLQNLVLLLLLKLQVLLILLEDNH